MASRRNQHRKNGEQVWTIVNFISRLTTGHWFGSKEKAEAYMSHHNLNPRFYKPIKLQEFER
jgi:hypothetical protein